MIGRSGKESLTISNISFKGNVFAYQSSAGLIDSILNAQIENCAFNGEVRNIESNIAGLATTIKDSKVSNCHIKASVQHIPDTWMTAAWNTGGFFTEMGSSTLERSSFEGNISSIDRNSGGISGNVSGNVVIQDVSINADISSEDCCTGGLFGVISSNSNDPFESLMVDNVIVTGDIHSGDSHWEAGIFGAHWVSEAEILAKTQIGDVYWDTDLSGVFNSGVNGIDVGGEGKTTFELQCPTMPGDANCDASLFIDWDETIWDFGTSSEYPTLR